MPNEGKTEHHLFSFYQKNSNKKIKDILVFYLIAFCKLCC